jgi:hypothetical protein
MSVKGARPAGRAGSKWAVDLLTGLEVAAFGWFSLLESWKSALEAEGPERRGVCSSQKILKDCPAGGAEALGGVDVGAIGA